MSDDDAGDPWKFSAPLHTACAYGLPEVVDELPGRVNLNQWNLVGETGLYIAACRGFPDIVKSLIEFGADLSKTTNRQETALHGAAANGHEEIVLTLLQHRADVAAKDDQGRTALDEAVGGEHEAVIRLLIMNGAEAEALQKYGAPLITWAKCDGHSPGFSGLIHRATGCVGIRNEGQTGYLNAILHLLYTIQPFYDLLQAIPFDRDDDQGHPNILTALERLFTVMETSSDIVSTGELTVAFGWEADHLQEPNDPFTMFDKLMDYFYFRLKEGPLFNRYYDLFWSKIMEAQGYRPVETVLYMCVSAVGNRNLESAMKEWATDDNSESPRYGLPRWQLTSIAQVLVIQLSRFQYNLSKDLIEKASFSSLLCHLAIPSTYTLVLRLYHDLLRYRNLATGTYCNFRDP
ncbi:MAG: hypothetical protein Q9181_007908 [Wetmoreana brouardii]